ncbi:hypothetical protein [Cupriavidus nantongensis]|uniref:EF-hand domain-containing protein n=1 Tax=Cupriavidus nantongensis TaxID=1796606 RepID=A0A142JHW3_9BURK|nr:hypothetical protein [Cupriavidus nantongensis]AMR77675.1 hypothetical protein A2G96_07970 [Cupriavidus nantongensis]
MNIREIWYEPHPVSPQRKAELRAMGVQVVDAVFKPEGYENPPLRNAEGLWADGPTIAEFIAAGYPPTEYPPHGYAPRSTAEEIASAIAAASAIAPEGGQRPDGSAAGVQIDGQGLGAIHGDKPADTNGDGKLGIEEIRIALTAKGINFDPKAKKADLQALLDAANKPQS